MGRLRWRHRLGLAGLLIVFVVPLLTLSASALTSGPPEVNPEGLGSTVFCRGLFAFGPTHTSVAGFHGCLNPDGLKTTWRFDYAESESGPWSPVPGDEGVISQVEAEEAAEDCKKRSEEKHLNGETCSGFRPFSASYEKVGVGIFEIVATTPLTGLTPERTYYLRLTATNTSGSDSKIASFQTEPIAPQPSVEDSFNVGSTSARQLGTVTPNGSVPGSETHWRFEYSTSETSGFQPVPGAAGTIAQAEAEAEYDGKTGAERRTETEAHLTGLTPDTLYYVRLFAENEPQPGVHKQITSKARSFETAGPPLPTAFPVHALHGEAVRALGAVRANARRIDELQTVTVGGAPTGGTFSLCLNGECTGGTATGATTSGSSKLSGFPVPLVKGTGNVDSTYRKVTAVATSVGHFLIHHPIMGPGIPPETYITNIEEDIPGVSGAILRLSKDPTASVSGAELTSDGPLPFAEGEAVSGAGVPAGATITNIGYPPDFTGELTLSANATETNSGVVFTANLPYDASLTTVANALHVLSGTNVSVSRNSVSGPYTVRFEGGGDLPQMTADASGLTPSGTVSVATLENGSSADTHYHFEYVDETHFKSEGGFAGPHTESTPEVDLGAAADGTVGADLLGLQPGEAYRFRLTATNNTAGNPVVHSAEQTLTVPLPPQPGPAPPCPNARFRTGAGSALPDCRAYEQVTPVDKRGTMEPFHYGVFINDQGALAGTDGDHVMLSEQFVHWGSGTTAGESPYFFSRDPERRWQMTAATLQPEASLAHYTPQLQSADLTGFAFSTRWETAAAHSPNVELGTGPPGGPYTTAASIPLGAFGTFGWVAASEDFSKLIIATYDRTLAGHNTGTTSGADLYEYSNGELRQVNTVGTCGAAVVAGGAEEAGKQSTTEQAMTSSRRSVSADGSRVFFEAVPGSACSQPTHLYMRVGGTEVRDLGTYHFDAANASGTQLLVDRGNGSAQEYILYDTGSATASPLFTLKEPKAPGTGALVSTDFNVIYVVSKEHLTPEAPPPAGESSPAAYLYRYDIASGTLRFELPQIGLLHEVSPDGRYVYGTGQVPGLPAGALDADRNEQSLDPGIHAQQAFVFDSAENVVECVSCASPFNPEPKFSATVIGGEEQGVRDTANGSPPKIALANNGDYAFFDTPAALVPSDVNGELEPEEPSGAHPNPTISLSTDVYEWRRAGVDGCSHLQGCVSLISSGQAGYLVTLLGASESGRDVFFTTRSQLGPNDNDNSLDIYDARIGGGEPPPPPRPIECEGAACSTPAAAPNDSTPSSFTFSGAGNLVTPLVAPPGKPVVKPCRKGSVRKHGKCVKRRKAHRRAAKRSSARSHTRGRRP
jgi:hypothetical protein